MVRPNISKNRTIEDVEVEASIHQEDRWEFLNKTSQPDTNTRRS